MARWQSSDGWQGMNNEGVIGWGHRVMGRIGRMLLGNCSKGHCTNGMGLAFDLILIGW